MINLILWPAAGAGPRAPQVETRQGYNLVQWVGGDMQAWAVSDLNTTELTEFVQLFEQATGETNGTR